MAVLRINPLVATDLLDIKNYVAEDNPEMAPVVITGIYEQFESILKFPFIGANLSRRVSFKTDLRYLIYQHYAILYKIVGDYVEIYRVVHIARDISRLFPDDYCSTD